MIPKERDLRYGCPPVYDQLGLNSCSANAVAAAVEFSLIKHHNRRVISPSRLFLYYNARVVEHTERSNVGVYIRDAVKAVAKKGDCRESLWPYLEHKFATRPLEDCYRQALAYRVVEYYRLHRKLDHFKACIASGFPFIFGFEAHENFQKQVRHTGVLHMPAHRERRLGKHAVLAVGFNDRTGRLTVRNSWGKKFGLDGYFTMPYEYLLNEQLTNDFWTLRVQA